MAVEINLDTPLKNRGVITKRGPSRLVQASILGAATDLGQTDIFARSRKIKNALRKKIYQVALGDWQRSCADYDGAIKALIPNVIDRMGKEWFCPFRAFTCFATRHGPFACYEERFSLRDDPRACVCREGRCTVNHLLPQIDDESDERPCRKVALIRVLANGRYLRATGDRATTWWLMGLCLQTWK